MKNRAQKEIKISDNAEVYLRSTANWYKNSADRIEKQLAQPDELQDITVFRTKELKALVVEYKEQAEYWNNRAEEYVPRF